MRYRNTISYALSAISHTISKLSYSISQCDIACDIAIKRYLIRYRIAISHAISYAMSCAISHAMSHAISHVMSHAIICFQVAGPARGLGKFCFQPRALQSRLRENALFYHRVAVPQHQRRRIKQRELAPARQILIHRLGWRYYPRPRLQFRRPHPPHQYHRALAQGGQQGTGSTTR